MLQHTDPMFSQGFKNEIVQLARKMSLGGIYIIQNVMGSDQSENCIFLREV